MAYKLNGNTLSIDRPFSVNEINYPANWLRLSTADDRKALGITEESDPVLKDQRFYNPDGSDREMEDVKATDQNGDPVLNINGDQVTNFGLKTIFKNEEKYLVQQLLNKYDWQVVRKFEKSIEIDSAIAKYRDDLRTAYETRKTEIDACKDAAALETLFISKTDEKGNHIGFNMTQYPQDPNILLTSS